MIIHNKRHTADLTRFYHTMMNDPDLYLSLYQRASGQSNDYIPTREELGSELMQYKVFKM
jgi:hypothetical protein